MKPWGEGSAVGSGTTEVGDGSGNDELPEAQHSQNNRGTLSRRRPKQSINVSKILIVLHSTFI